MSESQDKEIKRLKNKRAAKKGSITKRINEINQLLNDSGSRTKIKSLLKFLLVVKKETEAIDAEIANLVEDHDESWIESERERCDTVVADVDAYLVSRVDDPESTASMTESWVKNNAPGMTCSLNDDDDLETDSKAEIGAHGDADLLHQQYHPSRDGSSSYHRYPMRPQTGINAFASEFEPRFQPPPSRYDSNKPAVNFRSDRSGASFVPPSTGGPSNKNDVDSWIDDLDPRKPMKAETPAGDDASNTMLMGWFVQQSLPRMEIPEFDGSPITYIEFITKIRDLVHQQPFLSDIQRSTQLVQRLKGDAKLAVRSFSQNWAGYVSSLKKLKFLFGQRSSIARAVLLKVTSGETIKDNDPNGLSDYYYTLSECITTLSQLNYESDLRSTDTLLQAVRRLPRRLVNKWADYGLMLRQRGEDPNLLHFERWLQNRVLAQREACVAEISPTVPQTGKKKSINMTLRGGQGTDQGDTIVFWKTGWFKALEPSKRFEKVREQKRCFNCLSTGHITKTCPSKGFCNKKDCKLRHHTTLHDHFVAAKTGEKKDDDKPAEEKPAEKEVDVTDDPAAPAQPEWVGAIRGTSTVYLQVVPIILRANNRRFRTYALLDSASQFTLIRDSVTKKLNLKGEKGTISYGTVKKDEVCDPIPASKVSLSVSSMDGSSTFQVKCGYAVSHENFNMPEQPSPPTTDPNGETLDYIKDLDLKAVKSSQISILIGADVADATLTKEVRSGEPGQPLALNTMLGWTLYGTSSELTDALKQPATRKICHIKQAQFVPQFDSADPSKDEKLDDALERFWLQEQGLISPAKETAMSQEDVTALRRLESETKLVNNRYEVPMLWQDLDTHFPDNYSQARKRYDLLVKRLRADENLHTMYKAVIEDHLAKGYARKLTEEEVENASSRRWYVPHFGVTNPNKPGKVRVVKDAASEFRGNSLNKNLVTGPDLLNSLVGVLIRFRRDRIAIGGDIEAMYHRVAVKEGDSDSLCFLWSDDIFSDDPPQVLQMNVHLMGAKDSMTCCCYALQRTARDNSHLISPLAFETIIRNFYADDLLRSIPSEEVAIGLAKELISALKRGGFRITKFVSNSKEVLQSLPDDEISPNAFLHFDGEALERVLGIKWDIPSDAFTFTFNPIDAPASKRGILKVTCSLFDPLGILVPFILIAKLLLQELWRLGFDWDTELSPDLIPHWERWKKAAKKVSQVSLPRCFYAPGFSITEIQLHLFADASELAYGPIAYLRFSFKDGHHEVSYVISKSRLAPLKTITLPRLELSAGATAVRLYNNIIHEIDLPVERTFFWSDSTLTYQYISNTKHRFKVFPANRVSEILESSTVDQWRLVPGVLNPADILTRGVHDPSELMSPNKYGTSWLHGPSFLSSDEEEWPQINGGVLNDSDPEIKTKSVLVLLGLLFVSEQEEQIDAARFSSWKKLQRVAGWALRFLANYLMQEKSTGDLSCDELRHAERFIVRGVQRTSFQEEIETLETGQNVPRGNALAPLSPYLDDKGCLRVGGRLRKINLPAATKHQLILPKNHPVTSLVINHEHVSNGHIPPEHVLSNLRQRFWIINGRTAIRTILRKCFYCQVRHARQMYPFMADLPLSRAAYMQAAFANCGVDLFGPVLVKQGRKRLKRWIALFTCLTIRGVHLEVVESQDTDDFINSLRRFANRRGRPTTMYSDCGSNFKGAVNELPDLVETFDRTKIQSFATSIGVEWQFNPPSAPHMGGVWERLVRSVKEVLMALLQDKVLTDPQLATLLTEVESILNNRPLTHISSNSEDLEALTPNHLLLGLHKQWGRIVDVDAKDVTSRRHWRQVQGLAHLFWERWLREYLPEQTKRVKWRDHIPNFQEGELVVLSDELSKKKGRWCLARVQRTLPGDDGIVRTVELRTKDGVYTRPVSKLYRLEENFVQGEGC